MGSRAQGFNEQLVCVGFPSFLSLALYIYIYIYIYVYVYVYIYIYIYTYTVKIPRQTFPVVFGLP